MLLIAALWLQFHDFSHPDCIELPITITHPSWQRPRQITPVILIIALGEVPWLDEMFRDFLTAVNRQAHF